MENNFLKKDNKQLYLIFVLIAVLLITFFVYRQKNFVPGIPISFEAKKIEINFQLLENPMLKELQPFEEIKAFEGTVGRENPFLSY
ncbi:MAG: hypothetical protein V1756_02185 [Patescibacteria group bacterium]